MSNQIDEIKALAEVQGTLLSTTRELKGWMEKANGEIEVAKSTSVETKGAMEKLADKSAELTEKCLEIERRVAEGFDGAKQSQQETAGELLTKSDSFKAMAEGRSKFARVELKAAIVTLLVRISLSFPLTAWWVLLTTRTVF